jgi:hypothetical protein
VSWKIFSDFILSFVDKHRGLSRDLSRDKSFDLDEPAPSTLAPVGGGKEVEYFFASDARWGINFYSLPHVAAINLIFFVPIVLAG